MNQYGMFITKEGKNVLQPQSVNDYILNSRYNTLKIFKRVEGSISVPASGTGSATIAHGLGYVPAIIPFYKLKPSGGFSSSSWWPEGTYLSSAIVDNDGYIAGGTHVNNSEIQFRSTDQDAAGARTVYFKGLILVDPIDLVNKSVIGIPQQKGYGLKISKPGIDVTKAKAHELLISSQFESLKYHMEFNDSVTVASGSSADGKMFRHNLPYVPVCVMMIIDVNDTTKQSFGTIDGIPRVYSASIRIDRREVWFNAYKLEPPAIAQTWKFRIIVFKNKLSND